MDTDTLKKIEEIINLLKESKSIINISDGRAITDVLSGTNKMAEDMFKSQDNLFKSQDKISESISKIAQSISEIAKSNNQLAGEVVQSQRPIINIDREVADGIIAALLTDTYASGGGTLNIQSILKAYNEFKEKLKKETK